MRGIRPPSKLDFGVCLTAGEAVNSSGRENGRQGRQTVRKTAAAGASLAASGRAVTTLHLGTKTDWLELCSSSVSRFHKLAPIAYQSRVYIALMSSADQAGPQQLPWFVTGC